MKDLSKTSITSLHEIKETFDTDTNSKIHFGQTEEGKGVYSDSASPSQSQPLKTTAYQLPAPSMRVRYWIHWFRIGLGIFLLLSILMSLGGCSLNAATVTWNKAANVLPATVVEQVIVENTELNAKVSAKNILAWSVEGKDGRLAVFNLNTPDVCGALGCLYTGYWLRKDRPITQVFLSYLNPNLPPGKHLLEVGENRGQALPCIKVLQTEQEQLRQLNFCFNGTGYQLADSQLFTNSKKYQS
ncbi:hypothetical protein [Nostoc sp. 'Peltigera membranacea cyanobiont' 232]|uniref:hypothetical protein n=1 Tax=Nostoc sp. 'Peltigera membranacea cyanobiont' 232 TaxID=2014531 RepID=UPI000B952C19|nr:hypothetical protein [Nostoc sp. 'Peltigera membranacea cyanobiont' 232]OYE00766.1 hypothetical protein CDG79_33315 [Nostoc sp. 'Peltigera membranacea cyanobiont' 232]